MKINWSEYQDPNSFGSSLEHVGSVPIIEIQRVYERGADLFQQQDLRYHFFNLCLSRKLVVVTRKGSGVTMSVKP